MNTTVISVDEYYSIIDKLKQRNNVELIIDLIQNTPGNNEERYYTIRKVLSSPSSFQNFLFKCYIKTAVKIMDYITKHYNPSSFVQKISLQDLQEIPECQLICGLLNSVCSNSPELTQNKIIKEYTDSININELIQYIRTIAMTNTKPFENISLIAANISKQIDTRYPELFLYKPLGIDKEIKLMTSRDWYQSFENFIVKIITPEIKLKMSKSGYKIPRIIKSKINYY